MKPRAFIKEDQKMKQSVTICLIAGLILAVGSAARAVPTPVVYEDGRQDPLKLLGPIYDELGNQPPFPSNEWITSAYLDDVQYMPCPANYEPDDGPNVLVSITNMTNRQFFDLHYVADPETVLTNDDGWINGELAFRIDNVGVNQPLISESMTPNLVFEPGETWEFVIQNYLNACGLSPALFGSVGVPSGGDLASSGSIIAIPAPGAVLLGSIGVCLVGWLRRRRTL